MKSWLESFTIWDLIEVLSAAILVLLILSLFSCSSAGVKSSSYEQTGKEIEEILKHDNLTPAQKIVLKHAAVDLKNAEAQSRKQDKLQEQIVKASEKAGAGKMIYAIGIFIIFLVVVYIGNKVTHIFKI